MTDKNHDNHYFNTLGIEFIKLSETRKCDRRIFVQKQVILSAIENFSRYIFI